MTTPERPEPTRTEPSPASAADAEGEAFESRGLRMLVLGGLLTVLAPLAGFLGGSLAGESQTHEVDPLAMWLFGGLVIGGIGAVIAFVGGLRWVQANRGRF